MAKYLNLYRICAYLSVFFFVAHTFGGLLSGASNGEEADRVLSAMKAVRFDVQGSEVSWFGMYMGFGLLFSLFLLLTSWVFWYLGGVGRNEWKAVAPVAWSMAVIFVPVTVLCWVYFFAAPAAMATLITLLLLIANSVRSGQHA